MDMDQTADIRLSAGDLSADIHPQIGGGLGGLRSHRPGRTIDWLRPASAEALRNSKARDLACFPMLPFANRIRDGRFTFASQSIRLPRNFGEHPHTIHGHGWQAPWDIVEATSDSARLRFRHTADTWPWAYVAEQHFRLDEHQLSIEISVTNHSDTTMPAGIGFHPFFPRDASTTITGTVTSMWETDDEVMPTGLVSAEAIWPPGTPLPVADVTLDNCFTGWTRTLDIAWTGPDRSMRIEASEAFDFLTVFTPPGQDFFCAEPVSHCTDAINQAAAGRDDTGLVTLQPNQTLTGKITFRPKID